MKKIAFLTDSCADIPKDQLSPNIYILPMRVTDGENEFRDGINLCSQDVYNMQAEGKNLKTAMPSPEDITSAFDKIASDGYEKVIAVILSGKLSGSYNLVKMLAAEREDMDIRVFDSVSASLGMALIVIQAVQDAQNGMDFETLATKRLPYLISHTFPFFSIENLEHLRKGGRIGYVTSIAGTLLNIRPIIKFTEDGQLKSASKARGNNQVIEKLVSLVSEKYDGEHKYNLAVANGAMPEFVAELKSKLTSALPDYENVWCGEIGGTLSVHLGKGLLGAAVQLL